MLSVLNYILNIFEKYNNFNEYFVGEIGNSITIFQYINSCCLILFFIFLIIRFFIIRFGLKAFLMFVIKRLIFILLFSYGIYVSSDFTICDTVVNKSIKSYSSNLTNTQKQCIAYGCFFIIGTYLIYKCLVKLDKYDQYKNSKQKFENLYFDEKTKQYITENNNIKISEFNENKEEVKILTDYILANSTRLNITEFKNKLENLNLSLMLKYQNIKRLNPNLPDFMHFNLKQKIVEGKLESIIDKMYTLIGHGNKTNRPFHCDFTLLIEKERDLVMELLALDALYEHIIEDLLQNPRMTKKYYRTIVDTSIEVNRALSAIIESSDEVIPVINSANLIYGVPGTPGTALYFVGQNSILNPSLCGVEGYLTGARYFLLNASYVTLYPFYFVFNKTLGVPNPLNFASFKDSVWYFVSLKMFF